ncbi:ABC transporter ATP-binding protein [Nonomuraea jiangxiensis]|uniref:ABC-type Fe3+/spermidine/putrescine transport systems, ATPase components n=1 Tax=Nonomuraea jiangxiensis TaxID=633440 RepID=A0A1G9LHW3_9ACTN|nr:ATP-binding cassette domain-containing protein [Nonomuraea jiangxiensis]SDL61448.1 ABC-type Fe3+/spermidine/putrescine transport systems, ATPase components [Nonomuraea jiangxiensis]
MSAGIGCRDLRVHAGGRELLSVPELHVASGRTLAVLGPNGAGKSTLLRALGLLSSHRVSGQILLDGRPATRSQMRDAIGAVLQRPILRRGTVADNVISGLRFRGVSRREARDRARPWIEALALGPLADRDARSLSIGEAQRVSITRALAAGPRVLLLDEPFTGLDSTTRADLLADLRAALTGQPTATIMVTHDRQEALALAEETALLIGGRIRQHGPTTDVLDQPGDPDTARLLGYTNLLPPALTGLAETLVARPEHTRLVLDSHDEHDDDTRSVTGTLRRTVALGIATRVDVDTSAGPLTCLHPGDVLATELPPTGGEVRVRIRHARSLNDADQDEPAARLASGTRASTP